MHCHACKLHAYTHTHTRTHTHTHSHAHTYARMHARMHTHAHICICMFPMWCWCVCSGMGLASVWWLLHGVGRTRHQAAVLCFCLYGSFRTASQGNILHLRNILIIIIIFPWWRGNCCQQSLQAENQWTEVCWWVLLLDIDFLHVLVTCGSVWLDCRSILLGCWRVWLSCRSILLGCGSVLLGCESSSLGHGSALLGWKGGFLVIDLCWAL